MSEVQEEVEQRETLKKAVITVVIEPEKGEDAVRFGVAVNGKRVEGVALGFVLVGPLPLAVIKGVTNAEQHRQLAQSLGQLHTSASNTLLSDLMEAVGGLQERLQEAGL